MSTYKNIIGKPVKTLSSNLDNDQAEGQIWYNSTDQEFKNVMVGSAWSSASNLNNARRAGFGAGTQTAGLAAFGRAPSSSLATSEEYNGLGWATGGTANTARFSMAGSGTQTAAVGSGGYNPPGSPAFNFAATEEYDGSSWTNTGDLSTARSACAGFGIQTAAVNVSGYTNPGSVTGAAEHYNGSSWTSGGALNTVTQKTQQAVGTQTVGLAWGGDPPGPTTGSKITEEYDGSSWTTGNNTNIDRSYGTRAGTQTDAVCGGTYGYATTTEAYDGTTWSTSPATMVSGRRDFGGADGSSSAAFACGGYDGSSFVTTTEELTKSINVITAAAWASGGTMNTGGRSGAAGSGVQTASIIAGGGLGTVLNNSEAYDGNSWTNLPTLGTARGYMAGATDAPSTATVVFGGATSPGGPYVNNSEEYSGSSWSEGNNLNTGRGYLAGFGTQTAGAAAGGEQGGAQSLVEEYDGTSWSEVNNMPTAAIAFGGCGTQTAGLIIGDVPMKGATYDGTNWTTIPTLNTSGNYNRVFGTTSSAITAGRNIPPASAAVEEWNGTSWFTQASLATARFNSAQTGTTTAGLVAGPPTATEEFTAETSAVNVKTITTS